MSRVQRIWTLSALGLALMSPDAGAISVSDMRVLSTLGEPLRMELELYDVGGVRLDEIRIAQALPVDYSHLGLVPPAQADDISAQLRTDDKGRVLAVLQGRQPQTDPNVSLLLQLSWADGVRLQQVAAVLAPASVTAPLTRVMPVSIAEPSNHPEYTPVELAAAAEVAAPAASSQGEVSLTQANTSASSKAHVAVKDKADLVVARTALLSERDVLRAHQAVLEAETRAQDKHLKRLDAQLAALNKPVDTDAHKAALIDTNAWSLQQVTGLIASVLLLGLMVILLRFWTARTARRAVRAAALTAAVPEYEALKSSDSLATFAASEDTAGLGDADEPEYDFLTDNEAAAFQTRLDLAMAYLDMDEVSAARALLERVLEGGTSEQRRQASALLVTLA